MLATFIFTDEKIIVAIVGNPDCFAVTAVNAILLVEALSLAEGIGGNIHSLFHEAAIEGFSPHWLSIELSSVRSDQFLDAGFLGITFE